MAKEFSRAFYKSAAWQACRSSYWKQVGGLCEDCLKEGRYTPGVEVHHIEELTPETIGNPAVTLNPANLVLLCHDCHMVRHRQTAKRYRVDPATGAVVIPPLSENDTQLTGTEGGSQKKLESHSS